MSDELMPHEVKTDYEESKSKGKKHEMKFTFKVKGKKRALLRAYALCGSMNRACKKTGISYGSHYNWKRDDQVYVQDYELAKDYASDALEGSMYSRAKDGVEKEIGWYKGKAGGSYMEFDTTAGIFLLKGMKPDKYADRKVTTHKVELTLEQATERLKMLCENNPTIAQHISPKVLDVVSIQTPEPNPV